MRRIPLGPFRPSTFKLSVAAAAFALGLGSADLRPPPAEPSCAPLAVVLRTETGEGKYDSVEYETCRGEASVASHYHNDTYGFSIGLPDGMVGRTATPPAPQHGFLIPLDGPRPAEADASYNSLEWRALEEAVNSRLSFLRQVGGNVRVQSRTPTRLGSLSALRFVARYEKGGEEMVSDEIVAFRRERGGEASVVYTLDLDTTLANYERDRPVLEEIQRSWYLQPLR